MRLWLGPSLAPITPNRIQAAFEMAQCLAGPIDDSVDVSDLNRGHIAGLDEPAGDSPLRPEEDSVERRLGREAITKQQRTAKKPIFLTATSS